MAFDERRRAASIRRVAVIGSGAAGLSAAWLISQTRDVVVYDSADYLGGHANTVDAPVGDHGETVPVDAGFIVFNKPNYPNLTALFEHLGVAAEESCMSFAASMRDGAVEYSGQSLSSVFAQKRNALSPSFLRMLVDITRFHRQARAALETETIGEDVSLGAFVSAGGFGARFARDFLEPMASAIWSTPSADILDYPARSFFRFFANHGLLQVLNMPIWHTVSGGSRRYVEKISQGFVDAARLRTAVARIARTPAGVEVVDASGARDVFDAAVIATHADTALGMLEAPTDDERAVLGAFSYQANPAFVHLDARQMPTRRGVWSSWNYMGGADQGMAGGAGAAVTYWMNRLQNLKCARQIFVTLNPLKPISEDSVLAQFDYTHPVFDVAAGQAQKRLWSLQGRGGIWYCGAHFGAGFHEDAVQSGLAAAEEITGAKRPWRVANESGRIYLGDVAGRKAAMA